MERWRAGLAAMGERGELRPGVDAGVLALIQGGLLLTQVYRDVGQTRAAPDGALDLIGTALIHPPSASAPATSTIDP